MPIGLTCRWGVQLDQKMHRAMLGCQSERKTMHDSWTTGKLRRATCACAHATLLFSVRKTRDTQQAGPGTAHWFVHCRAASGPAAGDITTVPLIPSLQLENAVASKAPRHVHAGCRVTVWRTHHKKYLICRAIGQALRIDDDPEEAAMLRKY